MYKSCSFFGHRNIESNDDLKSRLINIVERLIKDNFGIFYFGGFGEFDDMCYKVVTELKKKYPHIRRVFCLYDTRHKRIDRRPEWLRVEEYEEYIYLDIDYDYWYTRIYYRNIEIINRSDFVIFYAKDIATSGAYKALKYAISRKVKFINLRTQ